MASLGGRDQVAIAAIT